MRQILKTSSQLLFRRQTNILSAATILMFTYAISSIIGLLKTRLLTSYFFGSQAAVLDAYNAAFLIPDTIFQIFVMGSVSATFIPIFNKYFSKSESEAWHVANSTISLTLTSLAAISVVAFIFAQSLAKAIAPGFTVVQLSVMTNILRISLIAQLFFCISGFLTSIIQSNQRFLVPALSPIAYNLGIIIGILFLSNSLGIYGPTFGVVLGAFLHMAIQFPVAWHLGFRPKAVFDISHPGVRSIGKLMPPRAIALGIDQIEQFVAVVLASLLSAGSLTLLNIARQLYNIPTTLFGVTVGQAALPILSQTASKEGIEEFRTTLISSAFQVMFIALPISILLIVLRIPIVRIIFGSRSFPWEATQLTGMAVGVLSLSAGFTAVMQLIVRGFYALHDTKTPLYVGLVFASFNGLLSACLVFLFNTGLIGIVSGITITNIVETLVLSYLLHLRISSPGSSLKYLVLPLLKITFTSLTMGIVLWSVMHYLDKFVFDTTHTVPLVALTAFTSIVGFAIYIGLAYLFKIEQLSAFTSLGKRFLNWRNVFSTSPSETLVAPNEQN